MFYPKSPCCPDSPWGENNTPMPDCPGNASAKEALRRIQELTFAAYDLQLYLDTHPYDKEALELFTQISATADSAMMDYQNKYGPLRAGSTKGSVPFRWVADDYDWPWAKEGEN